MFDKLWEVLAFRSMTKGFAAMAELSRLTMLQDQMLEEDLQAMQELEEDDGYADDEEDYEDDEPVVRDKYYYVPTAKHPRKEYDPDNPDEVPFHWE